ncbi:MAG: UDP-glucose 4-epimerase, partial [Aeromicrobium sp.]|nr:UDP-glucose 4-epimerase [Burkholderiales bacterium]
LNLGTGRGVSVLQMVKAIERASGASIPLRIVPRRAGDVGSCYANVERAEAILGWKATRSIDEMCADAWRWATRGAYAPDLR